MEHFFDPRETCRTCRKPWVPFSSVAITTSNGSVDGLNWILHVWELLLSTRTQGLTCCRHHVAPLITSSIDPNHHWSLKCSMCTLLAITTSNESVDRLNWILHVWELLLSTRTQGLTCCRLNARCGVVGAVVTGRVKLEQYGLNNLLGVRETTISYYIRS
jgi:hypothetical protein